MRPFLLVSSTDKERYEYAKKIAKDNHWDFISIEPKNAKFELFKASLTSTLNQNRILYFIEDAEKLSEDDCAELIKYTFKSPHRFFFSTRSLYKTKKLLKDSCMVKVLSPRRDDLFEIEYLLMTEPDRDKVRAEMERTKVEAGQVLHIFKNHVWNASPDVFRAVERCLQKLYIYKEGYLLSAFCYLFPPKRLPITSQKAGEKEAILDMFNGFVSKMRGKYPHLSTAEIRGVYTMFPAGWVKEEDKPKKKTINGKTRAVENEGTKVSLDRWF